MFRPRLLLHHGGNDREDGPFKDYDPYDPYFVLALDKECGFESRFDPTQEAVLNPTWVSCWVCALLRQWCSDLIALVTITLRTVFMRL